MPSLKSDTCSSLLICLGGEKVARHNQTGIRKAVEFLAGGGLLVIFHAEEVPLPMEEAHCH